MFYCCSHLENQDEILWIDNHCETGHYCWLIDTKQSTRVPVVFNNVNNTTNSKTDTVDVFGVMGRFLKSHFKLRYSYGDKISLITPNGKKSNRTASMCTSMSWQRCRHVNCELRPMSPIEELAACFFRCTT